MFLFLNVYAMYNVTNVISFIPYQYIKKKKKFIFVYSDLELLTFGDLKWPKS